MKWGAILLIAFGGPEKREDVRPFLANVLQGRAASPERVEEVVRHYELLGGRSPLNEITFRQARALERELRQEGFSLPVYVGMRNWTPYLHETLARMAAQGISRALGLILSAQQSHAGWQRYQEDVEEARQKLGSEAPRVDYTPGWHSHPLFIETMAERVREALQEVPRERRKSTPLVFTAHSLPLDMPGTSTYVAQVEESARLVAERLGHPLWSVAYQSRSASPKTPWLEPDLPQAISRLAQKGVREYIAVPIGFVCDHVEILYDLDIEARGLAQALGMRQIRAATANDHPTFIRMMAQLIRQTLEGNP